MYFSMFSCYNERDERVTGKEETGKPIFFMYVLSINYLGNFIREVPSSGNLVTSLLLPLWHT